MELDQAFFDLPLSWARTQVTSPTLRTLQLPLSRRTWAPCADVPADWSFQQLFAHSLQPLPGGIILQGCNERLAHFIMTQGGQVAQVGAEAVLTVARPDKPSVLTLARRGLRWGQVAPIQPDAANQAKMRALWESTVHGTKPQLQCAFRTDFDASVRGFALVSPAGDWLGAMTLSQVKPGYWHTELLLRHQEAPVGVMEALVIEVKNRLLAEGQTWLSLGTVPFVTLPDPLQRAGCRYPWQAACRGRVIARLGRLLRFGYNYRGLYAFKAKFGPAWQPLYLCGWPDLPWRILPDLSLASRHLHLVGYAAWQRLGWPRGQR